MSRRERNHTGLMFASRITLAHFSVSAAMCLLKSAGELENTKAPKSAKSTKKSG